MAPMAGWVITAPGGGLPAPIKEGASTREILESFKDERAFLCDEVFGLGVMTDYRGRRLFGVELKAFRDFDADSIGAD